MTDREKLIELISYFGDCLTTEQREIVPNTRVVEIADHLLANGVTLDNQVSSSKWIPVTERLPEESGAYLVATERDGVFVTHYRKRGQLFSISRLGVAITHWQERPLPPKGED